MIIARSVGYSIKLLPIVVGLAIATAASAQVPRSKLDAPATPGAPEFRDPKSGQIWTPENVGQDGKPLGPNDTAFDPGAQTVPAKVAEQRVRGRPVGKVPITAGPTVPIVAIDNASLKVVPGQRWRAILYLDNNSANTVDPVIECRFTNGANTVMDTRAFVQQTGPGVRQGIAIYGPRAEVFVDRVSCSVTAP
jgi:hypothetical protein